MIYCLPRVPRFNLIIVGGREKTGRQKIYLDSVNRNYLKMV
jgi:hypothetical protein